MLQETLKTLASRFDGAPLGEDYLPPAGNPFWETLPDEERAALREAGAAAAEEPWPPLPASLYMDFFRRGGRSSFEEPYFRRRSLLLRMVLAYCAGGASPALLDRIVDGLESLCDEGTWVVPAHNWPHQPLPPVRPEGVDLFAADTASLAALALHLLREPLDALSPRVAERVAAACRSRCLIPYLEEDGHWWMGFRRVPGFGAPNNWNPWISANFLHTLFLLPEAEDLRRDGVARSVRILCRYLEGLSPDGGCDEGPAYWVHATGSLFDCLDLLERVCHAPGSLTGDPWFRRAVSYLGRVHLGKDYFFNYADCSGRLPSLPLGLIRRMSAAAADEVLGSLTAYWEAMGSQIPPAERDEPVFSAFRLLRDLAEPLPPLPEPQRPLPAEKPARDCFPDRQIALFRGRRCGLTLACKGGHNGESHNHNDAGQFVLYAQDEPFLIDPGVGEYSRASFNGERYTIWTMQSAWHNLPLPNGYAQEAGETFGCRDFSAGETGAAFSLEGAYPPEAGVARWRRSLELEDRAGRVILRDAYRFREEAGSCAWHFISLRPPQISEEGVMWEGPRGRWELRWQGPEFRCRRDEQIFPAEDRRLRLWGSDRVYRLRLTAEGLPREGEALFYFQYNQKKGVAQ